MNFWNKFGTFLITLILGTLLFSISTYAQEIKQSPTQENIIEELSKPSEEIILQEDNQQETENHQQTTTADEFFRAEVIEIIKEERFTVLGEENIEQIIKVRITNGDLKGKKIEIKNDRFPAKKKNRILKEGDKIIVMESTGPSGDKLYYFYEKYRLPQIGIIAIAFVIITLFFTRIKGLSALLGLAFSIFIIAEYIIPGIANGENPLILSLIGGSAIILVSIYLAHGFNKRTHIAVFSTILTLIISVLFSIWFVDYANLFGMADEEASLQLGVFANIDLKGLLLAGIIIGTLGVLDDVTTAQSATIDEIKKANPNLGIRELYQRGLSVGKEHISSMINTLVLAYTGASLPVFLYLTMDSRPAWVHVNSEFFAEEIIRTLVGSTTLVLAVPLTTILAAYFFSRKK